MNLKLVVWVVIFLIPLFECKKSRTSYEINGHYGCFKLLNGTHSIGCGSSIDGSYGALAFIGDEAYLENLIKHNHGLDFIVMIYPHLFQKNLLLKIKNCANIKGIIILQSINETFLTIKKYSPDVSCPNDLSSVYHEGSYSNCQSIKWNSYGQGVFFNNWHNFPIFLVNNEESIKYLMENCYEKYNENIVDLYSSQYAPICSVRLVFEMYAVKDSITCLRRSELESTMAARDHCSPLGDYNVWSLYKPTDKFKPIQPRSLIVISAKLDSLTMFDGISPGAESSLLSVITLLSIADTLAKLRADIEKSPFNILFLLLNGESFEYIGSSSLIYDMNTLHEFPQRLSDKINPQLAVINTSHILHYIELGQVGLASVERKYWIHSDPVSRRAHKDVDQKVKQLINTFLNVSHIGNNSTATKNIQIDTVPNFQPLPPSSLQMFLRNDPEISAVLIADHQKEFSNQFYHSPLDNYKYVTTYHGPAKVPDGRKRGERTLISDITDLSSLVSRTLYHLITATEEASTPIDKSRTIPLTDIVANKNLVQTLMNCYLNDPSCDYWKMFASYLNLDKKTQLSNYVSVINNKNPMTIIAQLNLAYLLHANMSFTNITSYKDCKDLNKEQSIYYYYWFQNVTLPTQVKTGASLIPESKCVASLTWLSLAQSPAFRINADGAGLYDMVMNPQRYSTWVESTWSGSPKLSVYLATNTQMDLQALFGGIFLSLLTCFFLFYLKRYKNILFEDHPTLNTANYSNVANKNDNSVPPTYYNNESQLPTENYQDVSNANGPQAEPRQQLSAYETITPSPPNASSDRAKVASDD